MLALRLLNPHSHEDLERALLNRIIQATFGKTPDEAVWESAMQASRAITEVDSLPEMDNDILRMDTIWYSRDFTENGRTAIKQKLREDYISAVRELMPINKKYKTKSVKEETALTLYAIKHYWKDKNLTAKIRTLSSIVEAMEEVGTDDVAMIAKTAGVSLRTIDRYRPLLTE
jgi:hypothetical protein